MEERQNWGSRAGFIMAAVGSAVGLGNIWRFPYIAYENGGGAFLIPYLFALLTAGIPLLILEFSIGQRMRGSAPLAFSRLGKLEWYGWWQVGVAFIIATYYSVIIGWSISYTGFAVFQSWGQDTGSFLYEYLGVTDSWNVSWLGGIQWGVFIPLLVVWLVVFGVLHRGVKRGIEAAGKIFMPLLFLLMILMAIRGLFLDGAMAGLNAFFTPDWSGITNPKTWLAAYGQVFYSLSIAFAIMLTYASYLPKKSDINNNAFITAFADSGFSLISGVAIFSAIGFMATQSGGAVDEYAKSGVGLAFDVFPQILNVMPLGKLVGVLFFISLVFAGLTSLISIVETSVAAVMDKFQLPRRKAVNWAVGLAAFFSLFYATGSGLYILDTVDYFINNYGVALSGLFFAILMGWILNKTEDIRDYNNSISEIKVGRWWNFSIIVLTPSVLGYMALQQLKTDLTTNYGDYPDSLISIGWAAAIGVIVMGFYMQSIRSTNPRFKVEKSGEEEAV
ncbi:sodium-dependent transporter [Rubeoparvulum massiliense]|uniref:sodium-dependent transporter n=1 Tax=Rubeoparvulum massiliense TaxID=1631346 RepID=UPI00065DE724|nr:sodium-dependent transporter [Rubeoparvulum massiliense]